MGIECCCSISLIQPQEESMNNVALSCYVLFCRISFTIINPVEMLCKLACYVPFSLHR
uniref:Uncharacterized protein n=1 Tax=Rhizophora mucronata TaxID=61149 RepID=A0A2P2PJF0_RHIMU